jgi:uncharacterized protein (TIGR02271 family)
MASTVIGFYDTETSAQQVVQDLQSAGFSKQTIDFTTGERHSSGVADKLAQAGAPKDEAKLYEQGVARGGSLVTVTTNENEAVKVSEIMQTYEPIYVEALADWQGSSTTMADKKIMSNKKMPEREMAMSALESTPNGTSATRSMNPNEEATIAIVEEQMRVGKRDVERGGVRVRSYVTETPVEEQIRLRDETVTVDRRTVDRPLTSADGDLFKEQSFELTETDEEAVIAKEARVVEEVVVRKDVEERTETVRDTVRRTNVDVQQIGAEMNQKQGADYARFDSDFRKHYDAASFRDQYSYEQSQPAYLYGYTVASDKRYKDRNWNDVENDVCTDWEASNKGTWEQFKESVRYAWERARS